MNNGIDIKYIAAAMSEILKMDVPCNEIYFTERFTFRINLRMPFI